MKKFFGFILVLFAVVALVSCGPSEDGVQGVTNDEIKVGNTATTSGPFAAVGNPFIQAMNAVFDYYNADGGINGRKINFIHYDDQGIGGDGIALTEKLIEEDKIFALVGHFGTWNVVPTIEMIRDVGIPMVHAATGVNDLYFENTVGNPVMAIQPIYKTDGRVMTARAIASEIYGEGETKTALPAGSKVYVLYENDDAGRSIKAGIETQFNLLETNYDVTYYEVGEGTYATQVGRIGDADAIILAMNQPPFAATVSALHNANNKAPIFTTYVNADVSHIVKEEDNVGDIYINGWYSGSATDQTFYETILNASKTLTQAEKTELAKNTHAISGYIAAMSFVEGLKRVGKDKLTWDSFIKAMESDVIDLPLAGSVDFRNGQRIGTDTMSVSIYNRETHKLDVFDSLKTIEQILGE